MKFENWAKEILLEELTGIGQITYKNKDGWFCVTPNGLLLHVWFEKVRFGCFMVNYEIMPMVAPLIESRYIEYPSLGLPLDAKDEYFYQMQTPLFEQPELKSKDIFLPVVNETCVAILRNYLNPVFRSLSSLQEYCIDRIGCLRNPSYPPNSDVRRKSAVGLFVDGKSENISMPFFYRERYPDNYPWYTQMIAGMPYVYAALGKYSGALAEIEGSRQYETILPEILLELEHAMLQNDRAACEAIIDRVYKRNQEIVHEQIGLELPADWRCSIA